MTMNSISSCSGPAERGCCRRSEEHTSELQSRLHLVCRLLLEKKKKQRTRTTEENLKAIIARTGNATPKNYLLPFHTLPASKTVSSYYNACDDAEESVIDELST